VALVWRVVGLGSPLMARLSIDYKSPTKTSSLHTGGEADATGASVMREDRRSGRVFDGALFGYQLFPTLRQRRTAERLQNKRPRPLGFRPYYSGQCRLATVIEWRSRDADKCGL